MHQLRQRFSSYRTRRFSLELASQIVNYFGMLFRCGQGANAHIDVLLHGFNTIPSLKRNGHAYRCPKHRSPPDLSGGLGRTVKGRRRLFLFTSTAPDVCSLILHEGVTSHDTTISLIGEEAVDAGPQENLDFSCPIAQCVGISRRLEIRR
jgi:hypothetical protein